MKHLVIILAALLAMPVNAEEKSYTSKVKNTAAAWGGSGTYKAGEITCIEYYSSSHFYHGTFSQIITGLPVGVYQAEIYFNASCAAWECAEICGNGTTGRTHLYANDTEVDVPIYNTKEITEPQLYTLKNIHVSDGTLYLGARNDREGANWHLIRLKSLTYLGTDTRSLYDAQFPLIRQARLVQDASTCPNNREMLQTAIDESLIASAYDSKEHLQMLYDNITNAIKESESFETKKISTLKNMQTRLSSFQRTWNNGGKAVSEEQWSLLLPAVQNACIAKDDECDLEAINKARLDLVDAINEATGIKVVTCPDEMQQRLFTIDGRRASSLYHGILIINGKKLIQ